jgi:sugar phosphate isomerase/epimerase
MIYASTNCVRGGFWETLSSYRDAGITAVELSSAGDEAGSDPGTLVSRLRHAGLAYIVHNYFPAPAEPFFVNLASADDEIRRRSVAHARRAIDVASALGSTLYSVHAGFVTEPLGFDGRSLVFPDANGDAEAALERFRENLEPVRAHGAASGVEVIVENHVCVAGHEGKLLLQTADEFDRLPDVGILVDTGHLNVSARTLGFDRADFVRRLAPRIRAWHLHDNDGLVDSHDPVGPDSWILDLDLRDAAPIVEAKFATVEGLRQHLDWLGARL